jgi:hypothetical protein
LFLPPSGFKIIDLKMQAMALDIRSQDLKRLKESLEVVNKDQSHKYEQVLKSLEVTKFVHETNFVKLKELISRLSHQ